VLPMLPSVLCFVGLWQHTYMHHADPNADGKVSQEPYIPHYH
jgi:hypothetical protein